MIHFFPFIAAYFIYRDANRIYVTKSEVAAQAETLPAYSVLGKSATTLP